MTAEMPVKQLISSLGTSPVLLGVVVLAVLGTGLNYWFFNNLMQGHHERMMYLLSQCLASK